eukprot:9929-Eustigmatos_ZCMA.PRE.1
MMLVKVVKREPAERDVAHYFVYPAVAGGLSCGKCVRITGPNAGMSAKDGRGMTPIVGPIYAT